MERSRVVFSVLLALGFVFATTQTADATKVPRLVTYQGLIPGGGNATVKIDVRFYKNLATPDPFFPSFMIKFHSTKASSPFFSAPRPPVV